MSGINVRLSTNTTRSSATIPSGATKEAVNALGARVAQAEEDIDALESKTSKSEEDINALKSKTSKSEKDISTLTARMSTAEGDIEQLINTVEGDHEPRIEASEKDITALKTRITKAEATIEDHTANIENISASLYEDAGLSWNDYAITGYPLGWRAGYYSASTGEPNNNSSYIRTSSGNVQNIDWASVDHFKVTAPAGYGVQVAEYTLSGTYVQTYGSANTDSADVTTEVEIKCDGQHYYLFSVGKKANLFDITDQAFVDSIVLETYANRIDSEAKQLTETINTTTAELTQKIAASEADMKETFEGMVADEYNPAATYNVGDCCIYNNTLYTCVAATQTPGAFDASAWEETNIANIIQDRIDSLGLSVVDGKICITYMAEEE